jgi:hypothetical protein
VDEPEFLSLILEGEGIDHREIVIEGGNREGCSLPKGRMEVVVVTCPCHGSRFSLETGAVVKGPAEEPVPAYAVTVEGDGPGRKRGSMKRECLSPDLNRGQPDLQSGALPS